MTHSNGSMIIIDALVVGAGFSGTWLLHRLLQEGFTAKLVERDSDFGGVWRSHSFPGCRTDSPVPLYEFSDPLLWKNFVWSRRFPDSKEICRYFNFAADMWQLREHALFNQFVDRAEWNESECRWSISTREGSHFSAKFFLPCIGWASRSYTPDWPGKETFKGQFLHSSTWSVVEPDVEGKKIAVVGTGASGVQLVQTLCKVAESVVLFQRTPAVATPTLQVDYEPGRRHQSDETVAKILADRKTVFAGLDFDARYPKTFDHDDEQRRAVYQEMWELGDYHFSHGSYMDVLFDEQANLEAYKFWRNKAQAKVTDPKLKELLAPTNPPHLYAGKHVPLEDGYFEAFNQQNVHLVDLNATPIECLTEAGIKTTGKEWDFDLIIAATGYDTFTGGLLQMDIRGKDGLQLPEKWKDGVKTNFGLFSEGFPNMMIFYGPQAPTPFCNGPTLAEVQGDWAVDLIKHMRQSNQSRVETNKEPEKEWSDNIATLGGMSLLPKTKSYYFGDNIPGKRREFLAYVGGLPSYIKLINECADAGYSGFTLR